MPDYLALQAGLLPYYSTTFLLPASRRGARGPPFRPATSGPIALVAGRCGRADSTCCIYRRLARRMSEYIWLSKKG